MSICEDRITEDSTEFEKEFLKIYDGNLWTALDKMKDWQPPKLPVVVPQRFADWIESQTDRKNESYWYIFDKFVEDSQKKPLGIDFFGVGDLSRYPQGWDKVLLSALVDGYTVEKEKLFYLKSKMTGRYLRSYTGLGIDDTTLRYEEVDDRRACGFGGGTTFTQSEIDELNTGSYEQIEVKVEEVEK